MAKIAFLGLGQMGSAMAARLLQAGHEVTVWNRTPEKTKPLVEKGATAAPSPADAAAGAEIVITMLATPEALKEVVFGENGLAQGLRSDQIFVEMSTVGPQTIREVAAKLSSGLTMVDAPVLGSVPQATSGALEVFVGAEDDVFARVRPVLDALGNVQHVGGPGAGASIKLVVNLTLGAAITTLGEALALGRAFTLDRSTLLDVLEKSPIGPTVKGKRERIESGHYPPNFKLALGEKDLRLVEEAAAESKVELRVARAAHTWFADAAPLFGDLDYSAVIAAIIGENPLP
jgi:3-hydroxyisobutyrate dehydrogenase-like beta-hydroxyacid dehydrogenase